MTIDTSAIEDQFENTTSAAAVLSSNNSIRPSARDNQGTTRTRTRAGDVPASELKPNGKDTEPSKPALSTSITHFSTISRSNGARGPIGPRPGVYRPCARCRVKKTRCDRLKPSCSSCVKGGQDVVCVYDNDEPMSGVATLSRPPPSSMPQQQIETESQQDSKTDPEERRRVSLDGSFSIPKKSVSSDSMAMASTPTNGYDTAINSNGGSNNIPSKNKSEPASQDTMAINRSADAEPPLKKLKTGSVSTEALKPSPLRSSITKVRIPTTKSSTAAATKEPIDEPIDVVSVNDANDQIVSGLSIADPIKTDESWNNNKENANTDTNETQTKSNTTGATGRSRKQNKTTSANGASQSRIMVELSTAKPPSAFVIDKNKRARKWGRSIAAVQTLGGGELNLSLWKSDQEMLLNEPRPHFVQRPAPLLSGLGSATATSLARIAVLNQWDNVSSYDTPERGNTPESREMSPTLAAPSSPQKKFKRGSQKPDDGSSTATIGTKRKRNRAPSSSRGVSVHVDEDMEDSSSRSTPVPTSSSSSAGKNPGSRPRAIPTRPRTFACSFEGCGKAFMDKFHLKRHETRHVTQVIVCEVDGCDKAYDSISTMRRHQSMMHKEWKAQQQLEKQKQKQNQRSNGNKSGDEDDDDEDEDEDDDDDGDDDDNNNDGNDNDNDNDNDDEDEQQRAPLERFRSSPAPSSTAFTTESSPIRDQV